MVLCLLALSWLALPDVVSVVGGPFATSMVLLRVRTRFFRCTAFYEALTDISHLAAVSQSGALLTYEGHVFTAEFCFSISLHLFLSFFLYFFYFAFLV